MESSVLNVDHSRISRNRAYLFFLVLFSLKFFEASFAATGILKNLCFGFMVLAIALSLPHFFKFNRGFVLPIQLICVSIIISFFTSYFVWQQNIASAATTIPYMVWFVFFYLLYAKVSISSIEKVVIAYGIIYTILFAFQYLNSNVVYFGVRDEFTEDRGVVRIIFPGGGVFFLSCFMAINKITHSSKDRILWIIFALAGIYVVFLQVTRQLIIILLIMYLLHFLRNSKMLHKLFIALLFTAGLILFVNSNSSLKRGLVDQSKEDASYGKDYIRVLSAEYFLMNFNKNTAVKVFGNGFPNEKSKFGKTLIALSDNYGFFLSDVGLVELYIVFGIFAVFGYILIFIKSITIPLPPSYQYLKYYLWMLAATSLTSDYVISYYYLISTVLVLYIYQRLIEKAN